ncbi:MAG: hypothetical protein WBG51_01025 [Syntrophobacteria bacterium]
MEIWQFNDPEPLRPFLRVLENHAPHLVDSANHLLRADPAPRRADLICLAQGLVDSSANVRQAVRVLIFSPPVEEELAHFRRLVHWLPDWLPPAWYEHQSLRPLVAELISATDSLRNCRPLAVVLEYILKRRLSSWRQEASLLSGSLKSSTRNHLLSRLINRLPFPLQPGLRRRLLEKRDLSPGQICEILVAANRLSPMGTHRYWRRMVSLHDLASSSIPSPSQSRLEPFCHKPERDLRILSWGQRSLEEVAFLEKLISYQANELVEVFRLAKTVSQRTKRVVLTLHNASLGASSGWGVPSFAQQMPGEAAATFSAQVNSLRENFAASLSAPPRSSPRSNLHCPQQQIDKLFLLWGKRLVRPGLLQNIWALRVSLILNDLPLEECESIFSEAPELLEHADHQRLTRGKGLAVTLVPPTTASQQVHETLLWYQKKKAGHARLISLLWALIEAGEEWLRSERLESLVLPIIDKVFISSQRDQDLAHLPLFVQLVSRMDQAPLFLLIDDTPRAAHPSLQLAIDHWRQQLDFLGLGVYASQADSEEEPLETILSRSSRVNLFALRPLTQVHNPLSLDTLLAKRPQSFLSPAEYDSSWKDNLPFLYHGTQVAPFSGASKRAEQFSPALITSAGPMAFGSYYRHRLRQLALERLGFAREKSRADDNRSSLHHLWREYAQLANLL